MASATVQKNKTLSQKHSAMHFEKTNEKRVKETNPMQDNSVVFLKGV